MATATKQTERDPRSMTLEEIGREIGELVLRLAARVNGAKSQ